MSYLFFASRALAMCLKDFIGAYRKPSVVAAFGTVCRGLFLSVLLCLFATGCGRRVQDRTPDGRVIVTYWEKWTGFEADAMQEVVDEFNASQDRIFVHMLSTSQIDQKMLLATAGGNPPDLAGLWSAQVNIFSEKNALTPLDRRLEAAGVSEEHYLPVYWDLCRHRGFTWALPTTPATVALHWNKDLFREAGLPPDQPPRSIAELDEMAERLTLVELQRDGRSVQLPYADLTPAEKQAKTFRIVRMGFLPNEPGWWSTMWGYWFGADLIEDDETVACLTPENLAAFAWMQSYAEKYGVDNIRRFGSTFGNFASPQNPFLGGTLAMVLQGVWMFNFIDRYAPTLDWSAAPFPSVDPVALPDVTVAECDVLVIPRGARHPDEAFEFMLYVNSPGPMEKLNLGQRKFSPLASTSASFEEEHANPHIRVFRDLAAGPGVRRTPPTTVWNEYTAELAVAVDRVYSLAATPEEALRQAQNRAQWKLDRASRRWRQVGETRTEQWSEYADAR